MLPLNHKRTTSSITPGRNTKIRKIRSFALPYATYILCSKKWQLKDRRFPITFFSPQLCLFFFFKIFFWCAPSGYLYFLSFSIMNQNWVFESILAWLWHHFHLALESNPWPSDREPSALPLDNSVCIKLVFLIFEIIWRKIILDLIIIIIIINYKIWFLYLFRVQTCSRLTRTFPLLDLKSKCCC